MLFRSVKDENGAILHYLLTTRVITWGKGNYQAFPLDDKDEGTDSFSASINSRNSEDVSTCDSGCDKLNIWLLILVNK